MDSNFLTVLTGNDHFGRDTLKDAVAKRFVEIKPTLKEGPGFDHNNWSERGIYNGNRCKPENIGWRNEQNYQMSDAMKDHPLKGISATPYTPENILAGKFDALIEFTWRDAARAEYWYAYEKDWG